MQKISKILSNLLGSELDEKIKQYFISGAYKSIFLQALITGITFLTALFVARATGDKGFGIYTTVFTWVSIVSVIAVWGFDDLLLKYIPIYKAQQKEQDVKQVILFVTKYSIAIGGLAAIVVLALAHFTEIGGLANYKSYYNWAVWVIPLFALMHIWQATLRAHKLFGWGQLAEKFVQPGAFLVLLILVYLYQDSLSDYEAIVLRMLSFGITAIVAFVILWKIIGFGKTTNVAKTPSIWWKDAKYFLIASVLYIVNTRVDILFLNFYEVGEAKVAYYNAALKLSDLALVPFAVLYTVTAPIFSELYSKGDIKKLQSFYTKTSIVSFAVVMIILGVLVVFGEYLLLLFGESFRQGYSVLLVMCMVKFVHVLVGPANYLMMMVGLEKEATWALIISVSITMFLHVMLIPLWSGIGAALATLGGLIVFEILVSWFLYQRSGIIPTVLAPFFKKN